MLNVVVPIVNNSKRYVKLLTSLSNVNGVNVFVGYVTSQKNDLLSVEGNNFNFIEFKDGSHREEIINSLQKYLGEGAILILRKPITMNEFNSFANTKRDIVTCRRTLTKIQSFFMGLWQKILKLCLGVKLYDGDTSAIYFGDDISSVVLNSSNLSYNSRVNRWKGVDQDTTVVEGDKVKADKDTKTNINSMIISFIALLIGVVVTTIVSIYATVNIIVGLLLFCLDVICLSVILIFAIMTIFNNIVGKKQYGYAVEVMDEEDEQIKIGNNEMEGENE